MATLARMTAASPSSRPRPAVEGDGARLLRGSLCLLDVVAVHVHQGPSQQRVRTLGLGGLGRSFDGEHCLRRGRSSPGPARRPADRGAPRAAVRSAGSPPGARRRRDGRASARGLPARLWGRLRPDAPTELRREHVQVALAQTARVARPARTRSGRPEGDRRRYRSAAARQAAGRLHPARVVLPSRTARRRSGPGRRARGRARLARSRWPVRHRWRSRAKCRALRRLVPEA